MSDYHANKTDVSVCAIMSAEECFLKYLGWYRHLDEGAELEIEAAQDLQRACGAVWNSTKKIPADMWHDVCNVINHCAFAHEWEKSGHKYWVAARHIQLVLIEKLKGVAA